MRHHTSSPHDEAQPNGPAGAPSSWAAPWVQLKSPVGGPLVYPAMIRAASPDAKPGDLVAVYDKLGKRFGAGLYNPKARVPVRMAHYGEADVGEEIFESLLARAADWRLRSLRLAETSEAFRVVHSDGDGLSGLIVDRYAEVLSLWVHSLGVYQRLARWLPLLHERMGTRSEIIHVDARVAQIERIRHRPPPSPVKSVRFRENGVRFETDFSTAHKTGFFLDQRENRRRLAALTHDARVLDLCCYTGGFAVTAAVLGGPREVTGVDLDEKAIAQAQRNANLNQARVRWIHCDAFAYARQMERNNAPFDVVVVDPPKFVESREDEWEGKRKYHDLNGLAMKLIEPGGLLVTCSCSGLLSQEAFEDLLIRAAGRVGKRLQFFDRTGAGPDHPVMANCPESRYLKALWARVW